MATDDEHAHAHHEHPAEPHGAVRHEAGHDPGHHATHSEDLGHEGHEGHGTTGREGHGAMGHEDHAGHGVIGHEGHAAREGHGAHGDAHSHDHMAEGAGGINRMAASATLHCLTGCAIGEITGLVIGTAIGLSTLWTVVLAVALAFLFGYALSTLPLLKAGLALGSALTVVLAADTLSIATMEIVDNAVMAIIPGAMDAGLVNPIFWGAMLLALTVAFFAAYPVNRVLLQRGKGHALTHQFHHGAASAEGARRFIPDLPSSLLVGIIVSFMLGGLLVSAAAALGGIGAGGHG